MAKGLRSKQMRKNRSYLRATLSEPIAKQRQEKIFEELKKNLDEKKSTTTLMNLKSILPTKPVEKKAAVEEDAMEEEEEESEEEQEEVKQPAKKSSKKQNPFKKEKVVKAAKPKKELVWF